MRGYYDGSYASEWAAEVQVKNAPELDIFGVASGSMVPIIASLISITNQDLEAYAALISNLETSGSCNDDTAFLAPRTYSYLQSAVAYVNQTILSDSFVDRASVLEIPAVKRVIDRNGYTGYQGVSTVPMYVCKVVCDEYSVVEKADTLIARYCGIGWKILYQRNVVGSHIDEEKNGDQDALDWLQSVY